MVYPIDTRDFGGDLFVSWTPVNGAKEYRVSVIDSDGPPLMSFGLPILTQKSTSEGWPMTNFWRAV